MHSLRNTRSDDHHKPPTNHQVRKLTKERIQQVDLSHTVLATKEHHFDSGYGKAIPLCLPDDYEWESRFNTCRKIKGAKRNCLIINQKALEIIRNVRGLVCVVAIVGPCRTGKSYILSQLIKSSKGQQNCFPLGHTMDPETTGIWMWDTPIPFHLKDGKEVTVILLDTEGVDAYNASDHGDNQIFVLSVLLSSLLIYNSVQVPRRDDFKKMQYPYKYYTIIIVVDFNLFNIFMSRLCGLHSF